MSANKNKKAKIIPLTIAGAALCLAAAFTAYTADYYRADEAAAAAMRSDDKVTVERTEYGYLFDGPSETDAFIFYPGGKVEETAYAPLLREIAEGSADVCLVKMPFRLAVFGKNKADVIISQTEYESYCIGGHSLGGAMASSYAAEHADTISGLILCASYPTEQLSDKQFELSIYGSNDGVLNMESYEDSKQFAPSDFTELVIDGGNHAYFGSYGEQSGDNTADITPTEQQTRAAEEIIKKLCE